MIPLASALAASLTASGEPTAELISAVIGAFLAGPAVSILPGPIRGADTTQWAQATRARFCGIAAGRIGSQGGHLEKLSTAGKSPAIVDLNGGEPVDCELTARFAIEMARFGFSAGALSPSYGLDESTCAVTVPVPGAGMRAGEGDHHRGRPQHLPAEVERIAAQVPGVREGAVVAVGIDEGAA